MEQQSEHLPHRPSWACWACREPWPCVDARRQLAAELDWVQLPILMWGYLEDAAGEIKLPMREYFDRFVGWTRVAGPDRELAG